jgi:hypothetical protein
MMDFVIFGEHFERLVAAHPGDLDHQGWVLMRRAAL